jgi:hypothetical protein
MYDTPRLNSKEQPICEICEVAYDRLMLHVFKRHNLSAAEYKEKYNFHPRKGIQSKELSKRMSNNALKNYNSVIMKNLIIKGKATRFQKGNTATDKELVSRLNTERMQKYWTKKSKTKEDRYKELIKTLSFKS